MSDLYPLRFAEILRPYRFGERWIPQTFPAKRLPETGVIAETWEVCGLPDGPSVVVNGELAGASLNELIGRAGEALLGRRMVQRFGPRFPLLIKFLDVTHALGEQIHPNDEQAARLALGEVGKTEAWYMLQVRDGATIRCGNVDGATSRAVVDAMRTGTAAACMKEHAVRPGDAFLLYAGTMHCSAGGVLFYEIMQSSDAGVSLRAPADAPPDRMERQARLVEDVLRVEDGADFRTAPIVLAEGANRRACLLACSHFALERLDLAEPLRLAGNGSRFCVLTQIEGRTRLDAGGHVETLDPGNSCLLPACLPRVELVPEGPASVLRAYVPDLERDIVRPLRRAGVADERIVRLGGRTAMNPLRDLVQRPAGGE